MSLLRLDNIQVYYGHIHALKSVSLTVEEGEIVTLIGANGAGKSTTLRAISGLIPVRQGGVWLKGRAITNLPPHEIVRAGVGHVPEGRGIFPRLTVRENLEMGAFIVKNPAEARQRLEFVFQLFPRLAERLGQKGGTLSGGEQQMLAIGRGVMARPRILLLDEPSMGLSPVLVETIFAMILELHQREGTTILLVEQNANMALRFAARAYVLETGRIVLAGPAREIAANPQVREAYLGG